MSALDDLTARVQENATVTGSVVTLINGLAAQIAAAANDPAKIQALAQELQASTQALSDAVQANTPPPGPAPAARR